MCYSCLSGLLQGECEGSNAKHGALLKHEAHSPGNQPLYMFYLL